jgi:hypothetical protein
VSSCVEFKWDVIRIRRKVVGDLLGYLFSVNFYSFLS